MQIDRGFGSTPGSELFSLTGMISADLKNLHPDDVTLWLSVETATWRLALAAKLKLSRVRPMPRRLVTSTAGYYLTPPDAPDKEIWLSLRTACEVKRRGTFWGERWKFHQLLETVIHEVAHGVAGAGANHGPRFFRAFAETMVLAEDINIRLDITNSGVKLVP